jgi:hypothetical protein
MIIDFHVHVLPPEDMPAFTGTGFHRNIRAPKIGGVPTTIENALEAAKIGGVDITVISNPLHNLRDMDRQQQLERSQRQNRFHAAQQAKYPSIVGMASTVPYGGDAFLREFERAIKEDGLKGAWITSSCWSSSRSIATATCPMCPRSSTSPGPTRSARFSLCGRRPTRWDDRSSRRPTWRPIASPSCARRSMAPCRIPSSSRRLPACSSRSPRLPAERSRPSSGKSRHPERRGRQGGARQQGALIRATCYDPLPFSPPQASGGRLGWGEDT